MLYSIKSDRLVPPPSLRLLFSFSPPPLHPLSPLLDPAPVLWCLFPHFHIGKILNIVGWISSPGWGLYHCLHVSLHFIKLEVGGGGQAGSCGGKMCTARAPDFSFYCHIPLWAAPTRAALTLPPLRLRRPLLPFKITLPPC